MKLSELTRILNEGLKDEILEFQFSERKKRITISIDPGNISKVSHYLFEELKCRLITATAMQVKKNFEIYYHFSHDETGLIINVHVELPFDSPQIKSIATLSFAANWIEREMHELYGIRFLDHPDMVKLISEGNWPDGEYPYRKN